MSAVSSPASACTSSAQGMASSNPVSQLLASRSVITEKPGKKCKTDFQQGPSEDQAAKNVSGLGSD